MGGGGGGCPAASPLVLIEVPHHHPWYHEEHGSSWRDGDKVGKGMRRHVGTQGGRGDGLTPAEEEEGREAALAGEGCQHQELVEEESLGQQPPIVSPHTVLGESLGQPAPCHCLLEGHPHHHRDTSIGEGPASC